LDDQYRKGRQDTKREFIKKIETEEFWRAVIVEDGPEGIAHVVKVRAALAKATASPNDNYVSEGGVRCMHCQSSDLKPSPGVFTDHHAFQAIHCESCGKAWTDVYTLTEVEEE